MKRLLVWLFLFCCSGQAGAQSGTADARASCNASFHQSCPAQQTSGTTSSGFAAPLGVLGSSGLEGGLVTLLIAAAVARRLYRSEAGSPRPASPRGATQPEQASNGRRAGCPE